MHPGPATSALRLRWTVARSVAQFLLPLSAVMMFYLPAWTSLTLLARWGALTVTSAAGLSAALALTGTTWFYVPTPPGSANRTGAGSGRAQRPERVRRSRITGLPRLLIGEAGWTIAIGGSLALAGVLVVLVISRVAHSGRELVDLLRQAVRVADAGPAAPHDTGVVAFNMMVWYGLFSAAMATRFSAIMRHLRVLPIGAARLNALLLAGPRLSGCSPGRPVPRCITWCSATRRPVRTPPRLLQSSACVFWRRQRRCTSRY